MVQTAMDSDSNDIELAQSGTPPYLEHLNDVQREAVEHIDGPVLVLAGAGTGKTRVLTTRLAHILSTRRAYPGEILAVTFTNKAAQEMRERVSNLLGGVPVEGWWLGTFHALAARMLRRHAELVGLKSNFTILDPDDQIRLLKQVMEARDIDAKRWAPKILISMIDRWKDRGLRPENVRPSEASGDIAGGQLLQLYRDYQDRLKAINACDFGDLLLHMITIFKDPEHKHVLEDYHRRFRYILVDEYQDTNVAQYLWLRLLSQASKNICCVGDDDQSIYGWRGAEIGNILKFEKDFPEAMTIRLEQNYRSTGHILAAASGVIANNQGRLGKTLWSDAEQGEPVTIRGLWDGEAEARWIGEEIETLQRRGVNLSEMAVLVRTGFQTREFEERFIHLGIPYRVVGGPRFYERMEIRDAIAYFRVMMQPDDDLAMERIINTPKRGIGAATVQQLYQYARSKEISLHESILRLVETDELTPKTRNTLAVLARDFQRWREQLSALPHPELAGIILDESGYTAMWQADKSPDAPGRLENLKELVSAMAEFESMPEFLEHIALVMDNQDNTGRDMASIMTLHSAKGLEFDYVFLPGWEDGLFPSQRAMDENGVTGLEEERRLAYVGITRAKKKAWISHAARRRMYGSWIDTIPSRFIEELPQDNIDIIVDTGLYGGNQRWGHNSWQRGSGAGSKAQQDGDIIDVVEYNQDAAAEHDSDAFLANTRVFHQKFGYGIVISNDHGKLDIIFDKAGRKKVMDSFVERADK